MTCLAPATRLRNGSANSAGAAARLVAYALTTARAAGARQVIADPKTYPLAG